MVTIREYNNGDRAGLLRFVKAVFKENDIDLDLEGRHSDFLNPLEHYTHFFLAVDGGKIAGISALRILDEEQKLGEAKRLYALKEYHGLGVGQALLSSVITAARSLGLKRLRGDTKTRFDKAIAILEKNGFHQIERYNDSRSTHFYEKLL